MVLARGLVLLFCVCFKSCFGCLGGLVALVGFRLRWLGFRLRCLCVFVGGFGFGLVACCLYYCVVYVTIIVLGLICCVAWVFYDCDLVVVISVDCCASGVGFGDWWCYCLCLICCGFWGCAFDFVWGAVFRVCGLDWFVTAVCCVVVCIVDGGLF